MIVVLEEFVLRHKIYSEIVEGGLLPKLEEEKQTCDSRGEGCLRCFTVSGSQESGVEHLHQRRHIPLQHYFIDSSVLYTFTLGVV